MLLFNLPPCLHIFGRNTSRKRTTPRAHKAWTGRSAWLDVASKTCWDATPLARHIWDPLAIPKKAQAWGSWQRLLCFVALMSIITDIPGWWFGKWILFSHILGIIIPTDFHIFQRGRYTTNQIQISIHSLMFVTWGRLSRQVGTSSAPDSLGCLWLLDALMLEC